MEFGAHLSQDPTAKVPGAVEAPTTTVATEPGQVGRFAAIKTKFSDTKEHFKRNTLRYAALGASALALVGIKAATNGGGEVDPFAGTAYADSSGQILCDDFESANSAASVENYNPEAFLPKVQGRDAQEYVENLFDDNGPLGGKADIRSLAAMEAVVTVPAQRGALNDPNYSYVNTFRQRVDAYKADDGLELASEDCKTTYNTLVQVAEDTDNWTSNGDRVAKVKALRSGNGEYRLSGMEVTKPQGVQSKLSGIELKLRDTTKGEGGEELQAFPEVLISNDGSNSGEMLIKGLSPNQAGTSSKNENKGKEQDRQHNKNGGGVSANDVETSGDSSGSQFGDTPQTGETGDGVVPEAGEAPGPNEDNGGDTGAGPGSLPSPGPSGGSPEGGGSPPPSGGGQPPEGGGTPPPSGGTPPPSGGTPPPSGGTPPPSSPPPTTPPPSTPPKGSEPAPDPNNPFGD